MLLNWQPAFSTSACHAAFGLLSGLPISDPERWEPLQNPTQDLAQAIRAAALPDPLFWRHLLGSSASLSSNRELATAVLGKTMGRNNEQFSHWVTVFERCIDSLERALQSTFPTLIEELPRRSRPLQEQWEARGPGLLKVVGELTTDELFVEQATVLLVQPLHGGWGAAHLQYNAVRIEAVLTNADQALPEAVRLAWLLSQLNCDLPKFSETIPADRLEMVASLALLPPILTAAEEVEWGHYSPSVLSQALESWHAPLSIMKPATGESQDVPPLADIIHTWWNTYQAARPRWAVALAALDQMLPR